MSFDAQPWTEPGVYQVAPGVHRIPLPMPNDGLRAVNVYVIEDGDGVVLIDSGWEIDEAKEQLAGALGELGYELADVHRFLITHMHRDHYTMAVRLRREFGTRIVLGVGERPSLEVIISGDENREMGDLVRWGVKGGMNMSEMGVDPADSHGIYELPDEWLTGETDIALTDRTLRAVPTPGHTNGHFVFIDQESSLLFAGDHVLPHITPSIGLQPVVTRSALTDYLASLQLLLSYPDSRLLPAHGPVSPSAHVRVKELLAHHDDRLSETLASVREGATTAFESAQALGWTRRRRAFDELNMFNRFLAIGETAAHLEHLVKLDRLTQNTVDGVATYAVTE